MLKENRGNKTEAVLKKKIYRVSKKKKKKKRETLNQIMKTLREHLKCLVLSSAFFGTLDERLFRRDTEL